MAAAHVGPIGCLSALLSLVMLDRARVESPGIRRLVLSLPYIVLCQTLVSLIPQDQIVLRLILAGQYAWWSTFKVIAFVCNRGPLLEIPTRPVFFVVLLLPVSPLRRHGASASAEDPKLSEHHASEYGRKFAMKTALLAGLVYVLQKWQDACPTLILDCLYCLGLYSLLGVIEDGIGALFSASVLGIPVERSFDRFYFSANLAEFWSFRWNQHVAKLLKVVVYEPIVRGELVHKAKAKPKPHRSSLTKHTIKKALALILTFVASGVMHEVVFAYGSGAGFTPNFGWFKFFSLQGVYVLAEQVVGRAVKSRPPKWVSIVATLSFLLVTGDRHFFRAVREAGVDRAVVSNLHSLLS